MKIIKMLLAALLTLASSVGVAQTTSFWTDRAVGVSQFNGFNGLVPLQYAQVRVCDLPLTVQSPSPCQPVSGVLDVNGNPLPIVGGNFGQITTDIVGRFSFQGALGNHWIQIAATGSNTPQLSYPITIGNVGTIFPVFNGVYNVAAFSSVQAAITAACTLGGAVYVQGNTFALATGALTLCSNLHMYGDGVKSTLSFVPSSALNDAVIMNAVTNVEIDHLNITGNNNTARLLSVNSNNSNIRIHDNSITGAGLVPGSGPLAGIYVGLSNDIWIERNILSNGPAIPQAIVGTSEIYTSSNPTANNRVHIRGNTIPSTLTTIAIGMFDCNDCDIIGNHVNQSNVYAGGNNNGYGIMCYLAAAASADRVRISNNDVTNTAGAGIYVQTCNKAVVSGNTLVNVAQQEGDVTLPVAGIAVNGCSFCIVTSNSIDTSGKDGIAFGDTGSHNIFSLNVIRSAAQYGINIRSSSSDNQFDENNLFTSASEGIFVPASATQTRTSISNNKIVSASRTPIALMGACVSCDVSHNTITSFPAGFYAIASSNATTSGTRIDSNTIDNIPSGSLGGGIDLNLGINYLVTNNIVRNLTTQGILAEAGVADSIISTNLVKAVAGTGISTAAAARTQVTNNKLLSNGTPITLAATDSAWGNCVDTAVCTSIPLLGSLVTTAAASDNVTITGVTASSHCTISPTNAAAATNIATTYISAKAANTITVSHTAIANMNYDLSCTVN